MLTFVKLAAGLAALHLIGIVLIALAQDWLLFPRWAIGNGTDPLPASAERITVRVSAGDELFGIRLPAQDPPRGGSTLLLAFGGNAWNAAQLAGYLHSLFPDRDVVAFHYRGYAPSTGRPSAAALLGDALIIHDHLVTTLAPQRIVTIGLSLGAGPAAHLTERRPVAGAILVTPFDSLEALAREHYPWAPVRLLLRHRMDVAEAVAASSAPLALIAAERDTIVPPHRTEPLRKASNNLVLDRTIANAGHNDVYGKPELATAMRTALARIEAQADSGSK